MSSRRARRAVALLRDLDRRSVALDTAALDRSALVCAPHPDDETLGCGGTIALKREANADVTVVVLSSGERSHGHLMEPTKLAATRRAEVLAACSELGVDDVELLELPDGHIARHVSEAVDRLTELLDARRPKQLFVPFNREPVADHVATSECALAAAEQLGLALDVIEYPVSFWTLVPWPVRRRWGVRGRMRSLLDRIAIRPPAGFDDLVTHVELGPALDVKRRALERHRSQTTRLVDDPRWRTLADVEDGHLLRMLLAPRERFHRWRLEG